MTATAIKKLLSEAAFNPKTPGPLSAILESKDPNYLPQRAIELIREAQISTRRDDKLRSMKLAIQLLVMTQAILKASETEPKHREICNAKFFDEMKATRICTKFKKHRGKHAQYNPQIDKIFKEMIHPMSTEPMERNENA